MVGTIQQTLAASIPDVLRVQDYATEVIWQVASVVGICIGAWFAFRIVWVVLKWTALLLGGPIAWVGLWWKGK